MRDNPKLRNLFFVLMFILSFFGISNSSPKFFPWIISFIILSLIGIIDGLFTIYKDYSSKHVDKETLKEIFSVIIYMVVLAFVIVYTILKKHI